MSQIQITKIKARKTYEVIKEFDPNIDYGVKLWPAQVKCLSMLRKGTRINPFQFAQENHNKIVLRTNDNRASRSVVCRSLTIGKKIGIVKEVDENPMSFEDFCSLETVDYFLSQLRESRLENLAATTQDSTKSAYARLLYHFNNWLIGKKFEFEVMVQVSQDTYTKTRKEITMLHVEHFLDLYNHALIKADYIKIIKKYLLDSKHKNKKAGTMKVVKAAIKSYFDHNESEINFKFDASVTYHDTTPSHFHPFTIDDLFKLLTMGNAMPVQKAMILAKFQRGLDTITLCDRFNFQAWEQLVKYFGTEDYNRWDLQRCPVPIVLTRIKTDFQHTGFLDQDAITFIQRYLDIRYKKTGIKLRPKEPMFVNQKNNPITPSWVRRTFRKLAKVSGIEEKLPGYFFSARNKIEPHELRDLLKSTLIMCGTRADVADHVIGHMPDDSYEKQAELYPDDVRIEYMKGSHFVNIITNMTNSIKDSAKDRVELQKTKDKLSQEQQKTKSLEEKLKGTSNECEIAENQRNKIVFEEVQRQLNHLISIGQINVIEKKKKRFDKIKLDQTTVSKITIPRKKIQDTINEQNNL